MTAKKDKVLFFETKLNWITKKRGLLIADDVKESLHVATPLAFGGEDKSWTPEHLFLGAISSCFMTTFLAFADKLRFSITGFDCSVIGQITFIDGQYKFTTIDLYPKIFINDESLRDKATQALEKTHKYCIITNSVSTSISHHSEILVTAASVA